MGWSKEDREYDKMQEGFYVTGIERRIKKLEAENARLRKALEKYANPETHSVDENGNVWSGDFFDYKTARDALDGKE